MKWLRKKLCRHVIGIDDMELTHIPPPVPPKKGDGYEAWQRYYGLFYNGDHHTKRVKGTCRKCGDEVFAHSGLEIINTKWEKKNR